MGYWHKLITGITVWVGSINIYIGGKPQEGGEHYNAYCIEYNVFLDPGKTYPQTTLEEAPDEVKWQSISYILTWYHSESITNNDGFAIQVAVWKYATGTDPIAWNFPADQSLKNLAYEIYGDAQGKNVVRSGDTLTLNPRDAAVPVGETQSLTATLSSAKSGVKIKFKVELPGFFVDDSGGSIGDETEGITVDGQVTVKVKSTVEGQVRVEAKTEGKWAYILHMIDQHGKEYQNLIGIGYPEIAAASDVVFVRFFVIPEIPLGTATVTLVSLAALLSKSKIARLVRP